MISKLKNNLFFIIFITLLIFLPFSSWLVSLTGNLNYSLIRDLLIGLLFIISLTNIKLSMLKKPIFILVIIFMIFSLLSFFWRTDSALQWLRGARFLLGPIVMFLSLYFFNPIQEKKVTLKNIALIVGAIISILATLEFFGIKLPLGTMASGSGELESVHYVGSTQIMRLQAILAGPNALGLYLLSLIGIAIGAAKNKIHYLVIPFAAILLLTFSRSALIGLILLLISWLFFYVKNRWGIKSLLIVISSVIILSLGAGSVLLHNNNAKELITHGSSSEMRIEQYKRVWQERGEIGLFGRGLGTAGPSSQNRLDGGPNRWSENTYLEIYEEIGLIGIIFYLAIFVYLLSFSLTIENSSGFTIFLIGFSVAGLFINYYTGQVGIFLLWLAAGSFITSGKKYEKNIN